MVVREVSDRGLLSAKERGLIRIAERSLAPVTEIRIVGLGEMKPRSLLKESYVCWLVA